MFKAFGRWGSQVKSRIRIPFLSSLFGSKSSTYAGIDNDEEEIFSDAKEDLSDTEEDTTVVKNATNGHVKSSGTKAGVTENGVSEDVSVKVEDGLDTGKSRTSSEHLVDLSVHKSDDAGSSHTADSDEESQSDGEHDDHHDTHDDKKKIIRVDSKTNGMTKSPSTSTFKKVHRRISSLTQKQYSKLDSNANDDTNNLVLHETDDDHATEITEIDEDTRREKKPSRRKKVGKRARKSLRGSWKWMKRGMLGYARAFNTPNFFVINFTGAAATRKY